MEQRFTRDEWAAIDLKQQEPTVLEPAFSFLQELVESRLYKGSNATLDGRTAEEIARATYLCLMMLEILRYEDAHYAKDYATKTIQYDFDKVRSYATDLHNLIAILNHQDEHKKIKSNKNISVPALQTRRWMRDIANSNKDNSLDNQLFYKLDNFLKINEGNYRTVRRTVSYWHESTPQERKSAVDYIKQAMARLNNLQPDIAVYFKNKSL